MTAPVVDAQPLIDAIKTAVTAAGVEIDVGRKPAAATTRYIVAWPNGGSIEDRSMRSRDGWSLLIPFQCYGLSPDAALYALRVLRAAVLGMNGATVGGRKLHMPIPMESPPPLSRDDNADPPLWMQYDEWRIRTS